MIRSEIVKPSRSVEVLIKLGVHFPGVFLLRKEVTFVDRIALLIRPHGVRVDGIPRNSCLVVFSSLQDGSYYALISVVFRGNYIL